jgi:hypothetical protein
MFAHGAYVLVFAMLALVGFSRPIYPILFASAIVLNLAVLVFYERSKAKVARSPIPLALASFALVAIIARMFSPFWIAPGVAAVTAMAFMLGIMPLTRLATAAAIAIGAAAVLVPWIAEEVGLLSKSFVLTAKAAIVLSPGMQETEAVHVSVLAAYSVVLVIAAVMMAVAVRRAEAEARKSLHLQAWQLRQLVPIKMIP